MHVKPSAAPIAAICLCLALLWLPAGPSAGAEAVLAPGLYQNTDSSATGRLGLMPDGSLQFMLWQGGSQEGPQGGFAWLARLTPSTDGRRLAGLWESLPQSCCPGRGRLELEALGPTGFTVTAFSPDLSSRAWPPAASAEFQRVADLPKSEPGRGLAGGWRLSLWYTDLLAGQAADPTFGRLTLAAEDGEARGRWEGLDGQAILTPSPGGARLAYRDQAVAFDLEADLVFGARGLYLSGPCRSTLGQGRMVLTREGLPAAPPGPTEQTGSGGLTGLWVDPRTGNDFFELRGSDTALEFTAYGGSPTSPRYLSKGSAKAAGPGRLEGMAADVAGRCCGNQGRLTFRVLGPDSLEISAVWWPQNKPDPGATPPDTYVINRVRQAQSPVRDTKGWPLVEAARPGVPGSAGGALHALFTWQAAALPHEQTLFSQGGYPDGMTLAVDPGGRLLARFLAKGRAVTLTGGQVPAGRQAQAWLVYDAPGRARLLLDGREVAAVDLPSTLPVTSAPYLVGGGRWPDRTFGGRIESLEAWGQAVDPAAPPEPAWNIRPIQPAAPEQAAPVRPPSRELMRLWHPERLQHAYAVEPDAIRELEGRGFRREGPLGRLWSGPVEGASELWLHQSRQYGLQALTLSSQPPEGFQAVGRLGWSPGPGEPETVSLWELSAELPDPLRGKTIADRLYTTRKDGSSAAEAAGYRDTREIARLLPAGEPPYQSPLLYTWDGAWGGDGWGRFFITRRGQELCMFWYYAKLDGPNFAGRYRLSADGKTAEGIAVGRPGPQATYYRHRLEFDAQNAQGPRIKVNSWRLAAPLDDGRLVRFRDPRATHTVLGKLSRELPPQEAELLRQACDGPSPERQYEQALGAANAKKRLLDR